MTATSLVSEASWIISVSWIEKCQEPKGLPGHPVGCFFFFFSVARKRSWRSCELKLPLEVGVLFGSENL